jgi:glucosamine-6-phosphate deaminase
MNINISPTAAELGASAAKFVTEKLNDAIKRNGEARLVVSTGSSQFETLQALTQSKIGWNKVEIFHLDEYIDLPVTHKASFRKYLHERFISLIDVKKFFSVDTEGNVAEKINELTTAIREKPVDVGLIGIGENAHIAFNDPPADFDSRDAYKIVHLDDRCKMQQVNEGWFNTTDKVPDTALSMTVWQIMQCKTIVSCVPHKTKAQAIKKTLLNKLTNNIPSTMLKQHGDYHLYVDYNSIAEVVVF